MIKNQMFNAISLKRLRNNNHLPSYYILYTFKQSIRITDTSHRIILD